MFNEHFGSSAYLQHFFRQANQASYATCVSYRLMSIESFNHGRTAQPEYCSILMHVIHHLTVHRSR